eukprot:m.172407 g.172407  ORF g.172407 m.172407 type:complete len:625 (-) comp17295_c0_seq1:750-2624(-)
MLRPCSPIRLMTMSAATAAAVVVSAGGSMRSASSQAGMMLGRFASAWPRAGTAAGTSAAAKTAAATRAICTISSSTVAGSRSSAAAEVTSGGATSSRWLAWSAPRAHARAASSSSGVRPNRQHFRLVCSDDVRVLLPGQVRVEGRRHASADLSSRQMRFIEFDITGKQVKSTLKRSDLLSAYSLRPRDVRLVDGTLSNMKPQVLVRDNAIVFCMDHARAIITSDLVLQMNISGLWGHHLTDLLHRCLVNDREAEDMQAAYAPQFFTTSEDRNLILHANVQNLQYWERIHDSAVVDSSSDYELRALEAMLISVTMNLDMSLHRLTASINNVLQELTEQVSSDSLQRLLPLKTSLNSFQVQVRETSSALRAVLDDDELMGSMRLTMKKNLGDTFFPLEHHDHVERLFETYFHTIDEIQNEGQQLAANIKGSEEILSMAQDLSRNRIITLNLLASTGAFVVATGSMVASVFGMNVDFPDFLAHDWHFGVPPFVAVCGGVMATSALTAVFCYRYFYSHGKVVSLNFKGYSILSQLLPYTDNVEEEMYKSGIFDRSIDFSAFSKIVSAATPKIYSRHDLRIVFDLLDAHNSGVIEADRLLTILRGQQQTFSRHAKPLLMQHKEDATDSV